MPTDKTYTMTFRPTQVQRECHGQMYTVQAGDTLNSIAQKHGVSLAQLVAVNPELTNPNQIVVNQKLCIPTKGPGGCPTPGTHPPRCVLKFKECF